MPKKIKCPTAEQLYSARDKIAKASLRAALTEARELSAWAGRRVPNNATASTLNLALAMIVARVREETTTKVRHAAASTSKKMDPKSARRKSAQLAVRKTGRCDNCGTDFVCGYPGYRPPKSKRRKFEFVLAAAQRSYEATHTAAGDRCVVGDQAAIAATGRGEAALYGREFVNVDDNNVDDNSRAAAAIRAAFRRTTPAQARARKARGIPANMPLMDALQPEAAAFGPDWSGPDQSPVPRKEKIPNHKRSPTGKRPKASKGRRTTWISLSATPERGQPILKRKHK